MNDRHSGSNFDGFLAEENLLAECEAGALQRVVAWQIVQEIKCLRISRAKLAGRMKNPRTAIDQLLATKNPTVSLELLERAALALGRRLKVELA